MSYVFDWDDGEKIEMVDIELPRGWRILVDPRNTKSRMLSLGNQDIPVGGGIPVHLHEKEEEILFFHEGEAEMEVDGEVHHVKAGMTAFLPVGVTHGLRNTGDVSPEARLDILTAWIRRNFPPHGGHRHGPR